MKKHLLFILSCSTLLLSAEDLLRNAPWRFVTASGGAGSVEKTAPGFRKILTDADKGFVSFANSRNLPIVPGTEYTVSMTVTRENDSTAMSMLVSIGKRTPWASVKAQGIPGKPEKLTYKFTAAPGETGMRVHMIVSGRGSVTVSDVTLTSSAPEAAPEKTAAAPEIDPQVHDLLRHALWRTATDAGGKGKTIKLADGSLQINADSPSVQGFISFANTQNHPIVPGKTYLVETEFVRNRNFPLTVYVQIQNQRPWAAVQADGKPGKTEKIVYRFTAKPGENWLRVHIIAFGKGSAVIKKVSYRETTVTDANENWLASRPWRTVTAEGGKGKAVKLDGGKWLVSSNSNQGIVSFANSANQQIIPGKNYRITAKLVRSSDTVGVNMLCQIAKRRPWPGVKADGISGQEESVIYDFTAGEKEDFLRLHFIVSGQGTVQINSVTIQELSAADLQAAKAARQVTATDFSGAELRRVWTPINMRSRIPGRIQAFTCSPYGGVECRDLNWQADKIKTIEVRMAANEPGFLRLEFTTAAGQNSYLSCAGYPNAMRNYVVNVASNPAWKGKIVNVRIFWRAYERNCALDFERIYANPTANLIPFAADNRDREITLLSLLPRAKCELFWQGSNPGMTLTFFDRHNRELDKFALPAGKNRDVFSVPDMCTRTVLAIDRSAAVTGFPGITMLEWSKPDKKDFDWRGKWIWSNTEFGPANEYVWFKKDFEVKGNVKDAEIIFTADDKFTAYINGSEVTSGSHWRFPVRANAAKFIKPGKNTIVIKTFNESAWGGMIGELFVETDQEVSYYPTDKSWIYKIGGKDFPVKYTADALELGAPPTSPWGDLVYSYVGVKGKVTVKKTDLLSAVIHVDRAVPVKTDKLIFRLNFPDGSSRLTAGHVEPATDKWEVGKDVEVKISLPPVTTAGVTASLATDFIASSDLACRLPAIDPSKRVLAQARIEAAGSRPHFIINGEKYPPIYYDGYNKVDNTWMLTKAKAGGCKIVRITCAMHNMWKSENEFDFSIIDRYMDAFAVNYPEAKAILKVQVTMPDWWLAKYPDDVVAYHDGRPYSKAHDRQALASRRWLKDGEFAMRKLMEYLKKSPNADRIFAIGISEGWNSEWFWSTLRGATSGYSKGDLDTFKMYLKESYGTDAALAKAWNMPGMTFDKVTMPLPKDFDRASCGELLDPLRDQRTMDYFRFRNRALGDAIETFAKVIKEESDNRYLVGIYYGYFVMFSHVNRKLQTVGHLEIERLARSPYVDMFWAPSLYHWRQIGMPDGVMQAAETLTSHGKLPVVEQDTRTFSEPSHMQAGNGRTDNPDQTVNAMIRAFGMLTARGIGTHWYDMHEIWFRENVLLELMKSLNSLYMKLPAIKNTTPVEVCIVSDQESAYYSRHNFARNPHKGTVYEFLRTFNRAGVPFRHVFVNDLLDKGRVPAHKFYILTNLIMLTPDKYRQLQERFAAENATVLYLYTAGASRPDAAPSAENMEALLQMKFRMDKNYSLPDFKPAAKVNMPAFSNAISSQPWFYPVSGFDRVIATDRNNTPVLVKKVSGGITTYFSTLTTLHVDVLRELFRTAGVHIYSPDSKNNLHIGNDVLFIIANYDGNTRINLPSGRKLRGILGDHTGKTFDSGKNIPIINGNCYGFIVE